MYILSDQAQGYLFQLRCEAYQLVLIYVRAEPLGPGWEHDDDCDHGEGPQVRRRQLENVATGAKKWHTRT